jgi:leader peptidase (prepilin peptidase)/N-methyltransferase
VTVESWHPAVAVACALYGLVVGQVVPGLIARIPEPEPDPRDELSGTDERDHPPRAEDKVLYVDIARARGLRAGSSIACAAAAGAIGGATGWTPALSFLLFLVPVGVALAVVDWRTRRLPTKVIAPTYFVVAPLAVLAAWAADDWSRAVGALIGWAAAGGLYLLMWLIYPAGMGYGDVRLSGILGIALGWLGWPELLVGIWTGFLLGGVGGALLALLRIVDRKASPFGPFMLLGALAGIVLGPQVGAWYA